jgi:allantoinase
VPEFPPLTLDGLDAAMRTVDALFIVHAEDRDSLRPASSSRSYADFVSSRPAESEETAVASVIRTARVTGRRAHILHLSAASALPLLAAAKRDGGRVTAETCPHYLTLRAEDVPDGATQYKCCPPIRDGHNQDLLWGGLADGTIDCVVSDHSPCTPELKRPEVGDFATAWGGIASLQLGLPAVWSHARARGHSLGEVVRWMARHPADLVGLSTKGRIAVGCDADLVAFAPDEEFTVDPAGLHHRHAVTPYAGRSLSGVVHRTWLRGESIYVRGSGAGGGVGVDEHGEPRGRLLSREMG